MDSHYLVSTVRVSSSDVARVYMKQFTAGMYQSEMTVAQTRRDNAAFN
jgi:hypothetical protein